MPPDILLVTQTASRVSPPCPYFGTCGGCTLQEVAYPDQLRLKRERLRRALASAVERVPEFELLGLEEPWRYRNRAEFTFGQTQDGLTLGYHVAKSFWRVVDLEDCLLLPAPAMRAVRAVHAWAVRSGWPAYQPKTRQGFFRHVVVRHSEATGQVLLCVVTAPPPRLSPGVGRQLLEELASELMASQPQVCGIYWGVSRKLADVAQPDELTLVEGQGELEERIGPLRVRVGPFSFLQSSTRQAPTLYEYVRAQAGALNAATVWDLYCGLGLIGCWLAPQARIVYGIDSTAEQLELARRNALANGITNLELRVGRAEALLLERRFWLQEARPDVVVVDPPRAGLHEDVISSLLAARPRRLIYLSCNAASLARDLTALLTQYPRYRLTALRAFDLFAQTDHLEAVVTLERA